MARCFAALAIIALGLGARAQDAAATPRITAKITRPNIAPPPGAILFAMPVPEHRRETQKSGKSIGADCNWVEPDDADAVVDRVSGGLSAATSALARK